MKWISVKDRLPEYGTRVLVYGPTVESQQLLCYRILDGNMLKYCDEEHYWMPLPDAPQENKEEILNNNQHTKA